MIRPGMKIAEAILQLTKGFRKMMGRNPDGLEKIKIQQEAVKRIEEVNKVVDMEGNVIDTSKGIMGGKQIQDSPEFGSKIRETYDKAKGPGKGQEMVDALKSPGAKKSYEIIEEQLGVKLYGDETFEEIMEIQKTGKHPRGEPKADGGRIGYKNGPDQPGRRKFMKIMGGLATIPFVGKFFKGAKTAAPAVEKAAEVAGQAPSYFFDLVAKIKMFGKPGISIGPRQNTMNYKNYELMEDVSTGDLRITKQKGDPEFNYEEEVMEYRKGQRTEDGIIPDEYGEATIRPDMDGKMKDFEDGIEPDSIKEIIKEVTKEAPSIKKADGGIAMMLGE
jgi:hypothetical protein